MSAPRTPTTVLAPLRQTKLRAVVLGAALAVSCASERPAPAPIVPAAPPAVARPAASTPPTEPAPAETAAPAPQSACLRLATELPALTDVKGLPPVEVPPIVDATGQVMTGLYDKLARLLRGRAKDHVRIGVYGDSNMTRDFITGAMRRSLQGKYGDAGHGFVALARPWSHYIHMDVRHAPRFGFQSYSVTTQPPIGDAGYGFSGIAAESSQRGASTWVGTADGAPVGRRVAQVGVFYLKKPGHGRFTIKVDGAEHATIDTGAPSKSAEYLRFAVPDGPHVIDFVADTPRKVRLLGAVLERAAPGIVVDSLGVGAMSTRSQWIEDRDVNQAMLRSRPYDLVVFMTGTNDFLQLDAVPAWLSDIIEAHRAANPGVPVLLTSPPDRGHERSYEPVIAVGKQRREIAARARAAFWDLWAAMGGRGSMARFHDLGLGSRNDYIHLTQAGGAWVGERFVFALWRDVMAYLEKHPEAGCGD